MKERFKFLIFKVLVKIRKIILGNHSVGVIYETKNGIIASPIEDMTIGRHLGFTGNWDISEIDQLLLLINAEDNIYFLGTHIGTLLIPLSKKCKWVVGYEANPDIFRYLNLNICINEIKNISLFNYAVGDIKKKIKFYKNKINTGGSKIKPIKDSFLYNYDNPELVEIDMISLDDHIASEKLPLPNCIIVDIEGAEYFALKGMQKTLEKIRLLYIEYVPHHLKNVSNVSNQDFIDLIVPYFDSVKFVRTKKEINIKIASNELTAYLDLLSAKNLSDDLLFLNARDL